MKSGLVLTSRIVYTVWQTESENQDEPSAKIKSAGGEYRVEAILQWGLDLIIAIQQVHGLALDNFFRAVTFMGEEEFYLLLLPMLFWCVNFGLGARLAIFFMLSLWLNIGLKDLFHQPRPFELDQTVMLSSTRGYGLPSNHAQSAVVAWGSIALWGRKTWLWVVAVGLMILIGFSRVYLGVHFPTDVLAGWAIGVLLLVIYSAVEPVISKRLAKFNIWLQMLLALAVPVALLLIHPGIYTATAMGTLAGIGLGLALTRRYVSFNVGGLWWHYAVRFIIGSAVVFALYRGLKIVSPGEESAFYMAFRFLSYGLVGAWASLGAPWLFQKLKLSKR